MSKIKDTSSKRYTVLLKENAYIRLKSKGIFGESFSEVIDRLLDDLEKGSNA